MARKVVKKAATPSVHTRSFRSLDERNERVARAQQIMQGLQGVTQNLKNREFAEYLIYAVEQYVEFDDSSFLNFVRALREPFVGIEEFLDSPNFLGATDLTLWPEVRKSIIEINKYWWKGHKGAFSEVVLAGATGTGKTEISKVTAVYRLHILGCMKNPQQYYGLPAATTIVFAIQAAKPHVTKKVVYMPLRKYVEVMPWFSRHMRPDDQIESEMYFEKLNIRVSPGGSDSDTILGEAVIGGIIDEANFMNVVEKSKKAGIGTGRAGTYDQAQSVYDALTRRKKGRFLKKGPEVGMILVSSSTRYKGDFTDKRIEQVESSGTSSVYIYRKAQFQVKPQHLYSGDTFRIHIDGGAASEVRILKPDEFVNHGTTLEIPMEYLDDFEKDPYGALRDIVGLSTSGVNPFFRQPHKIIECMEMGRDNGLESIVEKDNVVLGLEGMPRVIHGHYCQNPSKPRYVHVDLSLKSDRVGIAMVRHDGVIAINRPNGDIENLPMATVELAVTIEPDQTNEIDIAEIRTWIRQLKTYYGYPIKVVSYDFWNSTESRQVWKKWGMKTAYVPSTAVVYAELRDAIYDKRLTMYQQDVLYTELSELDFDEKANGGKGKVDHPPNGYKDCADAVAGAYHVLLHSPSSWNLQLGEGSRPNPGDRYSTGRA